MEAGIPVYGLLRRIIDRSVSQLASQRTETRRTGILVGMTPTGALVVVTLGLLGVAGLTLFGTSFRPTRWNRRIAGLLLFVIAGGVLAWGYAAASAASGLATMWRG